MRTNHHMQNSAQPTSDGLSATEWRDFQDGCNASISRGGEHGDIAAKMLGIGERMRALSAKLDAAIERYCS